VLPSQSADAARVRGHIVAARFEYLERHHGRDAVATITAELSARDRACFKDLQRVGWYPLAALARLDRAIERRWSMTHPNVIERLGEASALNWTEWAGTAAGLISVHAFLSLVAERHREMHSFGRAAYTRLGFSEGELSYSDYPEIDDVWCRSAIGFLRGAIVAVGGRCVRSEERLCQRRAAPACVFHMHWEGTRT
jgi:hypothetical protein